MRRRSVLQLGLAASAVAGRGARAAAATPVRYASVGGATDAPVFLAEEYGFFREGGLAVEVRRLESASTLLAAVATGQIDAGGISATPGLFASLRQGINLRIVGDRESIRKDFAATQLVARTELAEGGIGEVLRRLKGRRVAVSGRTSVSYMLLGLLLQRHGMAVGDVTAVELSYGTMYPAMLSGGIDAAVELEPYLTQIVQSGLVRQVSDFVELVPAVGACIVPLVYGEAFIGRRAAAQAFMLAYMKGVRVYNDAYVKGIERERVIEIVARHTNVEQHFIRDGNPISFDPDQRVDPEFLALVQAFFVGQRLLATPADLNTLIDPSFAQEAVRVLGAYR